MPRKALKCIVEVDLHVTTCPGTFLRDYEYVYLHMEMLGLEARTKSVPPTFPLFFHERLKFERTFYDCTDPALVAAVLKGEDLVIELRQHTDYISDGKVISHCSSNTHDFLYPAIPPYYGNGREILLYKTAKFKPIRVTGEPVKLEFSTKTIIKEVPDYETSPRRSASPNRSMRRSVSPTRPRPKFAGNTTVESIPATLYRSSSPTRHMRSMTEPTYLTTTARNLSSSMNDLNLSLNSTKRRLHTVTPNLNQALRSSDRIQRRVNELVRRRDYTYLDSDVESDYSLDLLRESLRDERNALNDAIKEADREAFYRSLHRTR